MEVENLRALVTGHQLTTYQKRMAVQEFNKLIEALNSFIDCGVDILHAIDTDKVFIAEERDKLKELMDLYGGGIV